VTRIGAIFQAQELMFMKLKESRIFIAAMFCCTIIYSLPAAGQSGPEVSFDVRHDVSPPLRDLVPNPFVVTWQHVAPIGRPTPAETKTPQPDPLLRTSIGPLVSTTAGINGIHGVCRRIEDTPMPDHSELPDFGKPAAMAPVDLSKTAKSRFTHCTNCRWRASGDGSEIVDFINGCASTQRPAALSYCAIGSPSL
jgi:hypothetical protein